MEAGRMMEEQLWSIGDVAQRLNVSSSTVRRWIRNGRLKGRQAGTQWRFEPKAVLEAFEKGRLSGATVASVTARRRAPSAIPEWAEPLLSGWRRFLEQRLQEDRPDQVVVVDRRGSKIWALLVPDRYSWGNTLWHSTALRLMTSGDLQRLFGRRTVWLFDEITQYGRDRSELRKRLEEVGAKVISVVCVRRRSVLEGGRSAEYDTIVCDDVDDTAFADLAAKISRLTSVFEPPLDVDHLVLQGSLKEDVKETELLERMSSWGIPFVIWYPDDDNQFLALTLDRPQFFETADREILKDFGVDWDGPCKVRFYINRITRSCYCSFVAYPTLEAPAAVWTGASVTRRAEQLDLVPPREDPAAPADSLLLARRIYRGTCLELAWQMLSNFLDSGAAEDIGVSFDRAADLVDIGQLRATYGPTLADTMARRTREILRQYGQVETAAKRVSRSLPLFIRNGSERSASYDSFECRGELLKAVPRQYSRDGTRDSGVGPLSYRQIFARLASFSEPTIGQTLDYELDRGTTKPAVDAKTVDASGTIRVSRSFYRGEFGVWFEWDHPEPTDEDAVIQRTLGLAPTAVQQFLRRTGQSALTAVQFAKLFANLQHDWRSSRVRKNDAIETVSS